MEGWVFRQRELTEGDSTSKDVESGNVVEQSNVGGERSHACVVVILHERAKEGGVLSTHSVDAYKYT